ncbi:hypothetical protein LTR50_005418 [Elasticomyces elasticus]|nr:hypothetical protein LTR50_005418 [Elasticomyces elasticus]
MRPTPPPLPTPPPSRSPPPPFHPAPPTLSPLLPHLTPSQVYITHIDHLPAHFKRRIFSVPVLLNLGIALLLAWRAYVALPVYLALLGHVLGYSTAATAEGAARSTTAQLVALVLRRTAMFAGDFVLFRFVAVWPFSFFLERDRGNPVVWRARTGFRDQEVVVRASRGWGAEDLLGGVRRGEESPFWKTRVVPAVDGEFLRKTGYLMMGKSWDLDFAGMVAAHELVQRGEMAMRDLERVVLAHSEEFGWLCWDFGRAGGEKEDGGKIRVFKDALTRMGKEGLFFRWVEIVQFEAGQEGGLTEQGRRNVLRKGREAFGEQGVDFDGFVEVVGGVEGLPGLEQVRAEALKRRDTVIYDFLHSKK